MTYYKKIKGKNYDKKLLDLVENFTNKKGDGRISLEDAKTLLEAVKDSNSYTDIEKSTISYIRKNYKFTESADKWFRTEIRKWAASKSKSSSKKQKTSTKEAPQEENLNQNSKEEVIPLIEEIEGTEKIIPPPTIPKIDTNLINEDLSKEKPKANFLLIFILGVVIILVILLLLWQPECSKKKEISKQVEPKEKQEPISVTEKNTKKITFTKEDLEKTKLEFHKGSFKLTEDSLNTIKKIAELLQTESNLKIKIIGHSCDIGTENFNKKISIQRAEFAKKLLVSENISPERILTEGKGFQEPILPNDTEENRSKNRRIEFQIVE